MTPVKLIDELLGHGGRPLRPAVALGPGVLALRMVIRPTGPGCFDDAAWQCERGSRSACL